MLIQARAKLAKDAGYASHVYNRAFNYNWFSLLHHAKNLVNKNRAPWDADYEIEEDQVRAIVNENTDLIVETVRFLGSGWDFFNWLINDHWVIRLPKRHSDIDTLVHERRVLSRLNLPVPTPRFEIWIDKPEGFHKPIAGYVYLRGSPLLNYKSIDCNLLNIGRTIGETLTELHSQSLTRPLLPVDPVSLWFRDFDELVAKTKPQFSEEVASTIGYALRSYQLRERTEHQVTAHNDLGVEHILMHDRTQVAGLIDWSDTATINGFVDFAGLWAWGGDAVLRTMLEHYFRDPDRNDLAQIRTQGLCYALDQISYGRAIGDLDLSVVATHWIQCRVDAGELDDIYSLL